MSDRRRTRSEAEDDDLGLRTPTRRQPSHAKRAKGKSGKRSAVDAEAKRKGAEKPAAEAKKPSDERPAGAGSGKRAAAAGPPRGSGPKLALLGGAVAVGVGALAVLVLQDQPPRESVASSSPDAGASPSPRPTEETVAPEERPSEEAAGATQPAALEGPAEAATPEEATLEPPAEEGLEKSTLEELASRSGTHAEVAGVLEEYSDIFKADLAADNRLFKDFAARQEREKELIERLRSLGPLAVEALSDMLLGLENRAQQIFLAKGLAGIPGSDALGAVQNVLGEVKDAAIQTTLVRYLPDTPEAVAAVGDAYAREDDPNLRTMLLREYSRRSGEGAVPPGDEDLFREAALEDPDQSVRAEAVTIMGRRGRPEDQGLLEEIARTEDNVQIRQRAMVALAETGGQSAMGLLEDMARNRRNSLPIRASAVLAIGRVGGDQAIASLDMLAQSDPDQEIRTRANRLAQSLRARREEAQNPDEGEEPVEGEPLRVGPQPGGVRGLDQR